MIVSMSVCLLSVCLSVCLSITHYIHTKQEYCKQEHAFAQQHKSKQMISSEEMEYKCFLALQAKMH